MIEDQLVAIYSSLETHLLLGIIANSPQYHLVLLKLKYCNTKAYVMLQKKLKCKIKYPNSVLFCPIYSKIKKN